MGQTVSLEQRLEKIVIHRTPVGGVNVIAGEVKDLANFGKDNV